MTTLTGDAAKNYIAGLINNGNYKEAEPVLLDVLRRTPDNPLALTALGIVYRSTGRPQAAEVCYRRVLMMEPDNAEACSNFSNLLTDTNRLEEALHFSEKAAALKPDSFLFRKNLGVTRREAKDFRGALKNYHACLKQKPGDPDLLLNIGLLHFYLGEYEQGWAHFEARLKTGRIALPDVGKLKVWNGEDLKGKKLLVLAEQGFGDTLLMTRFLPLLQARGATVTLACKPALHRLLGKVGANLIADSQIPQTAADYYITMMSIPRLIEKDWAKWPKAPSVSIPDSARQKFSALAKTSPRLKIGIVWSGSVTFGENAKRSVELERFLALATRFPQIQFYSFQKGPREKDMIEYGSATLVPLGHMFKDFAETAAALQAMDAVLMTDSALMHLAGAMDIPVIDLLSFKPYWLYFPEKPTTPLYDSVRFVRQPRPGDWDDVFARVENILDTLAAKKGKSSDAPLGSKALLAVIDKILSGPEDKGAPAKAAKPRRKKS